MQLKIIFTIIFLSISTGTALASLKTIETSSICNSLKEYNLQGTKDWHDYGSHHGDSINWGCNSNYKDIGENINPYDINNNLAFYANGTKNEVKKVYLVLNINNKQYAESSKEELIKASMLLYYEISRGTLSQDILNAIKGGGAIKKELKGFSIEIERIDWPTGNGYEIRFIIK